MHYLVRPCDQFVGRRLNVGSSRGHGVYDACERGRSMAMTERNDCQRFATGRQVLWREGRPSRAFWVSSSSAVEAENRRLETHSLIARGRVFTSQQDHTTAWTLETTLVADGSRARGVRMSQIRPGVAAVFVGGMVDVMESGLIMSTLRHVLRLDEDLSRFYERAVTDPDLAWVTKGGGRMLRSPNRCSKTWCPHHLHHETALGLPPANGGALVEHFR